MFLIPCPYCGARPETEFSFGGEAHISRPPADEPACEPTDQAWARLLFLRDNPKGWTRERWRHATGCGRWFNLLRNTATNEIAEAYEMDAPIPPLPSDVQEDSAS